MTRQVQKKWTLCRRPELDTSQTWTESWWDTFTQQQAQASLTQALRWTH